MALPATGSPLTSSQVYNTWIGVPGGEMCVQVSFNPSFVEISPEVRPGR
jgi:hypothetical protein